METSSSSLPLMNDSEIQCRVESLAGPNAVILDCEKKSSLVTEEVLLLNGVPIRLVGEAGERIKAALKAGQPPPQEILSEILIRSGIQIAPVQVETVTTVKSNTKTSEVSTLTDSNGMLVDEKMKEFEEDDEYESTNVEVWEKEPAQLLEKVEQEKNKMWDFYNSNLASFAGSNLASSPLKSSVMTNITEESDKLFTNVNRSRSRAYQVPQDDLPPDHFYENVHQVPSYLEKPQSRSNMSTPSPTFFQRVPHHELESEPEYANVERPKPMTRRIPGKMPPLSIPSNPKLRPPVPPKPTGIRFSPSGYIANLRTDKNLTLPVRVVYETFI